MNHKKAITASLVFFLLAPSILHADEISDIRASLTTMANSLISKYEARIRALESENANLKSELAKVRVIPTITATGSSTFTGTITPSTSINSSMGRADLYNSVIKTINGNSGSIFSENGLSGTGAIGLFEFVEPNAVFISVDDGKNPPDVSAFKTKLLYTFDEDIVLTRIGLFDLDYASQKYRTTFGTNPYTKAVRLRVQNPLYKGKLFDIAPAITGSGSQTTEPTFAQIKAAYGKNKILDALKLSDVYILKNPNDVEVLRIRYRGYYMIGKYEDSLAEVKKIEKIQGNTFEKIIACDASVTAKIIKNKELIDYYGVICKKK